MDQKELQQKIAEYYQKLPSNLQSFFSSMIWLSNLNLISQKYGLSETGKETLGTETTLLLLGIINIDEYEEILRKEIISPSIEDIFEEIYETVLKDVFSDIEDAYHKNVAELSDKKINQSNWSQNIDFVLSGGDYSSFLKGENDIKAESPHMELENFNLELTDGSR